MIESLMKPEYLLGPRWALRRLFFRPCNEIKPLPLRWHCTILGCSAETIGRYLATRGLYDLPLTEAIIRLTDAGDSTIDIGANIGYVTLVLSLSAGPEGRVVCYEPNPSLLPTLRMNVNNWKSLPVAPIQVEATAISDRDGEGILGFPDGYVGNRGLASLEVNKKGVRVRVSRLDSLSIQSVGIMKLDVEGHEAAVLSGAAGLLARRSVRDILFEEHEGYPALSHKILLEHAYHIFRVTGSTFRPLLLPPGAPTRLPFLPPEYPPNYLATVDPDRASERFKAGGWYALSTGPRLRAPARLLAA